MSKLAGNLSESGSTYPGDNVDVVSSEILDNANILPYIVAFCRALALYWEWAGPALAEIRRTVTA